MRSFLTSIEDRFLLLLLAGALIIAYIATGDKDLSNMAMLVLGASITVLKDRAEKTLVVSDSEQSKAIVNSFLGSNN